LGHDRATRLTEGESKGALASKAQGMHHIDNGIYVHRRKPLVPSPASNGFHECGHIQEDARKAEKAPITGAFSFRA